MSEIGFHIKEASELSDDEFNALRRHYLVYAWAERDEHRNLHKDLDAIYTEIDGLVARGGLLPIVNSLNTCGRIVIFSTESSTLSLREFQQAMLVEDKTVHLVPEDSPSTAMLDTLTPNDLLIVVTTSNGFAGHCDGKRGSGTPRHLRRRAGLWQGRGRGLVAPPHLCNVWSHVLLRQAVCPVRPRV